MSRRSAVQDRPTTAGSRRSTRLATRSAARRRPSTAPSSRGRTAGTLPYSAGRNDLAAIAALDDAAGLEQEAPSVDAPNGGRRTLLLAGIEENAARLASRDLSPLGALPVSTWRGQQYGLALFPVWITACWTAFMNVVIRHPLDFVLTSKERQRLPNPLLVVRWQVIASVVLLVATVVGVARLAMGVGEPLGTAINVGRVVVDLVLFSVLVSAVRFRGYEEAPQPESAQPEKKEAS